MPDLGLAVIVSIRTLRLRTPKILAVRGGSVDRFDRVYSCTPAADGDIPTKSHPRSWDGARLSNHWVTTPALLPVKGKVGRPIFCQ